MPHMKPNLINISTELLALFKELDVTKPVTPDQLRKFTVLVTQNTISDSLYRAITNNTRELLHLLEQLTDEIHNQLLADGKLAKLLPKENLERRSSTEPLHIAVEAGYVKMVDTLVNKLNFDPEKPRTIFSFSDGEQNFTSQTPLQLVKKAPADSRVAINDVLSLAISNKSQRYIKAADIIARGDAEKFKQAICREGKPALFLLNKVTPLLHLAALHGQLDIVTWLIDECNANPNKIDPETGSNILGFIEYKAKELRKDLNTPTYHDIFIKLFEHMDTKLAEKMRQWAVHNNLGNLARALMLKNDPKPSSPLNGYHHTVSSSSFNSSSSSHRARSSKFSISDGLIA